MADGVCLGMSRVKATKKHNFCEVEVRKPLIYRVVRYTGLSDIQGCQMGFVSMLNDSLILI